MAGALTDRANAPGANAPGSPGGSTRAVKIALLAASGVTLAFLFAAMVRENFMSEWRYQQREYRRLLLDSSDPRQRKLGETFEVKVRQVDLPQFGTTDRCVTCHVGLDNPAMADARQPFRPHSGDILKHHPVARYGCTVCHQGQGPATNFREAKASDVHWDYPLLPARMAQASCGQCHAAESALMKKHAPALHQGHRLFVDRGCQSCHKLDGVGGQLGPALDGIADKTRHQLPMAQVSGERTLPNWLLQHFDQPQKIVAGSQMRPPRLTAAENDALTIYMLSLRRRDIPQTYVAPDRIASLNQTLNHKETGGPELYKRYCTNCHGDGTFGSYDRFFNKFMPAVRGPGLRALELERRRNNANAQATTVLQLQPLAAAAFSSYFVTRPVDSYLRTAIEQGRPGTLMPSWGKTGGGLTNAQVDSLVDYLLAGDGRPAQELRQKPAERRGNAEGGGQLFAQLCAGCHGGNALAPSLANAAFQKSASDTFIAQTIANGRHDTAMPAFQRAAADGLSDEDIADLLSYIRSLGRGTTAQP